MAELLVHGLLDFCSLLGVFVFSVSGALFAAEKKMDILGFILVGAVTAMGGGTLRDLLLGVSPVVWVQAPHWACLSFIASTLTYFFVPLIQKRDAWILWLDAIGLAAFAILGAQAALSLGTPKIIAVVMGVMSATFGGILRDVLCAEVLTLMRPEIYITCALLGASLYVFLAQFNVNESLAIVSAFAACFGLRAAAIIYKLELPRFSS